MIPGAIPWNSFVVRNGNPDKKEQCQLAVFDHGKPHYSGRERFFLVGTLSNGRGFTVEILIHRHLIEDFRRRIDKEPRWEVRIEGLVQSSLEWVLSLPQWRQENHLLRMRPTVAYDERHPEELAHCHCPDLRERIREWMLELLDWGYFPPPNGQGTAHAPGAPSYC